MASLEKVPSPSGDERPLSELSDREKWERRIRAFEELEREEYARPFDLERNLREMEQLLQCRFFYRLEPEYDLEKEKGPIALYILLRRAQTHA